MASESPLIQFKVDKPVMVEWLRLQAWPGESTNLAAKRLLEAQFAAELKDGSSTATQAMANAREQS